MKHNILFRAAAFLCAFALLIGMQVLTARTALAGYNEVIVCTDGKGAAAYAASSGSMKAGIHEPCAGPGKGRGLRRMEGPACLQYIPGRDRGGRHAAVLHPGSYAALRETCEGDRDGGVRGIRR